MCCDVVGCVSVGAAVASAVRGCGRLPSPAVDGGARSGFGRLCCMRLVVSGSCGSSVGVGGGAGEGAGSRGSTDCAPILEGWLLVGGVLGQPVWLVLAEAARVDRGWAPFGLLLRGGGGRCGWCGSAFVCVCGGAGLIVWACWEIGPGGVVGRAGCGMVVRCGVWVLSGFGCWCWWCVAALAAQVGGFVGTEAQDALWSRTRGLFHSDPPALSCVLTE